MVHFDLENRSKPNLTEYLSLIVDCLAFCDCKKAIILGVIFRFPCVIIEPKLERGGRKLTLFSLHVHSKPPPLIFCPTFYPFGMFIRIQGNY